MSRIGQFKKGQQPYPHKIGCGCSRCTKKNVFNSTGIKQSEEHIAKRVAKLKGRVGGMTGKKQSSEWRENHRKWALENRSLMQKAGLKGLITQQYSKKPTSIEKIIYDYLILNGVVYEKQKLINNKFLVDIYIPSLNVVIEVDGKYWHSLPRVQKKDKAENAYLKKCGYKIFRISEQEIHNNSYKTILSDCVIGSKKPKFIAGKVGDL